MTTIAAAPTAASAPDTLSRPGGFLRDAGLVAGRVLRITARMPAEVLPNLAITVVFYLIQIEAFAGVTSFVGVTDPEGFFLAVAVFFATAGGAYGLQLATDIERGYFDKLLLTPVNRWALLIGSMGGDLTRALVQVLIVVGLGVLVGAEFGQGAGGAALLVLLAMVWAVAYAGIGYAIALRTGSTQATQVASIIFLPLNFLTTAFVPEQALSGWLRTAVGYNPVTYLLDGLRALLSADAATGTVALAFAVVGGLAVVTLTVAATALGRRAR